MGVGQLDMRAPCSMMGMLTGKMPLMTAFPDALPPDYKGVIEKRESPVMPIANTTASASWTVSLPSRSRETTAETEPVA